MKVSKIILFIFIFFQFAFLDAQVWISEKEMNFYRWISIENNEKNDSIFYSKPLPTADDDFLLAVRKLVIQDRLALYLDTLGINEEGSFKIIPEVSYAIDYEFPENNRAINRLDYLTYNYQNFMPLMDEFDQPLIKVNADGNEEFIYANSVDLPLITDQLGYFKIILTGINNNSEKSTENLPLAIGFKPSQGGREIWLDWKDLEKNPELLQFPCIQKIRNNQFEGFQYRQFNIGLLDLKKETTKIYGILEKKEEMSTGLFSDKNQHSSNLDFVDFIVEMVNQEKIQPYFDNYYLQNDFPLDEKSFLFTKPNFIQPKAGKPGDVKLLYKKGAIFVDEYGEPLRIESEDSLNKFMTSDDEWIFFNKYDITKLWIKQGKLGENTTTFGTNSIVFFNTYQGQSQAIFSIDVSELAHLLENTDAMKWYTFVRTIKLEKSQIFMQSRQTDYQETQNMERE